MSFCPFVRPSSSFEEERLETGMKEWDEDEEEKGKLTNFRKEFSEQEFFSSFIRKEKEKTSSKLVSLRLFLRGAGT